MDELHGWQKATLTTSVGTVLVKEMARATSIIRRSCSGTTQTREDGTPRSTDSSDLWDPQNRTVLHPRGLLNNVNLMHYPSYTVANTPGTALHLYDEMDHAIGDGGRRRFAERFLECDGQQSRHHRRNGVALVDEQVLRTDPPAHPRWRSHHQQQQRRRHNQPYREREGSVNTIREVWSPIYIEMNDYKTYPAGFNGTLVVINRYDFTNTNQVKFKWQLVNMNSLASLQYGHTVMKTGTPPSPAIRRGPAVRWIYSPRRLGHA